jgi:hypothetical protein
MSTFANPSKAAVWLDGDAFRGAADATPPADPFAASLAGFEAFGGVKAGFVMTPTRPSTDHTVWNVRTGPYRNVKGLLTHAITFRAVDMSKATALTLLTGGTITETAPSSGIWKWTPGDDENFSFLFRTLDGTTKEAYFVAKGTLAEPVPQTFNDEDLAGYDFNVKPLAPASGELSVVKYTNTNPLA